MISSSIYHIVEDPSKNDIEFIIKILFKEAELNEVDDFNFRCSKYF